MKIDDLRALLDAATKATPVAWMHDAAGRVDVIHDSVRELWLKTHRQHSTQFMLERVPCKVEHYTIPLYSTPSPDVVAALARIALAAAGKKYWFVADRELISALRDAGLKGDAE